ncbi:MAG: hypothetical protein L6Q29_02505 [Candidatus Pacebacteria bacterium]|nr:hypothetical protein [Candidatus Paceibacterota bacterium]NUQ57416.1 hypothetical protein [Candidatus Paceibacter sp.]
MEIEDMTRQARNKALINKIETYKKIGLTPSDAGCLAELGQTAFNTALVKAEIDRIKEILKKYPNKKKEIIQAIKDNFPSYVEIF